MKKPPYDSLSKSLVVPFVTLGYVVSALLSLVTFGIVSDLEERAIVRVLQLEMESIRSRHAISPADLLPASTVFAGYVLPDANFPELSPVRPGQEYIEVLLHGGQSYSVMVAEIDGTSYALVYDRSFVNSSLGKLALFLIFGTGFMTLLSALVGRRLARQVVRPIAVLLDEVSEKATRINLKDSPPLSFSSDAYPNNEIGRLVQCMDQFALRLQGFLDRESHFAADVSHELRTSVAIIRGAAELLVEYPYLPEAIRHRLQTVLRQAVRMGHILEAMLHLAREDKAEDDPACVMAEVIGDAVTDCTPALAGRPVRITVDLRERSILPVERSMAWVVVSNLLRNACAYTKEGEIAIRLDGNQLEIVDSGIGIPEDRFPALFKRLDKGEESTGYGLGLSIVARVVQRLGWKLEIQSSQGTGTRVCITLMTPENSDSPRVHRSLAPGTPMYFGEKRHQHANKDLLNTNA